MLKQSTQKVTDEVFKVQEDLRRVKMLNDVESVRNSLSVLE